MGIIHLSVSQSVSLVVLLRGGSNPCPTIDKIRAAEEGVTQGSQPHSSLFYEQQKTATQAWVLECIHGPPAYRALNTTDHQSLL